MTLQEIIFAFFFFFFEVFILVHFSAKPYTRSYVVKISSLLQYLKRIRWGALIGFHLALIFHPSVHFFRNASNAFSWKWCVRDGTLSISVSIIHAYFIRIPQVSIMLPFRTSYLLMVCIHLENKPCPKLAVFALCLFFWSFSWTELDIPGTNIFKALKITRYQIFFQCLYPSERLLTFAMVPCCSIY